MAVKQQYNIVGRYINEEDARDVVGYHLRNLDGTKQGKYSVEQVAFLVGKDQVLNCTAQLYKDKVLFRGKGISLESLPTQRIKVDKANRVGNRNITSEPIQNTKIKREPPKQPERPTKPIYDKSKLLNAEHIKEIYYNHEIFNKYSMQDTINKYLSQTCISKERVIELYSDITNKLIKGALEEAYYTTSGKVELYENSAIEYISINIDFIEDNMYYISLNKWGFSKDTIQVDERETLLVSKSTMLLLKRMFPQNIIKLNFKNSKSNYKRAYYHEIVIRLRAFRFTKEFKWLKLHYLSINDNVFGGKLPTDTILMGYNYDEIKSNSQASAFRWVVGNRIAFNGKYNNLQHKRLTDDLESTLIHEMCHLYTDVFMGGAWENDRSKYGDVLFGMAQQYENQFGCHGEKFGKAVKIAEQNCKYTFNQIFGYGLGYVTKEYVDKSDYNTKVRNNFYDERRAVKTKDLAKKWYTTYFTDFKSSIENSIQSHAYSCIVDADRTDFNTDGIEDKCMLPIAIQITNNASFNELYKLNFEFNQRGNLVVKLYRDFNQSHKGYMIAEGKINISKFTRKDMDRLLNNIVKQINNDLVDA